jgi:uncharacterized membrane protein YbaN (DUF454 family)
MSELQRWMWIAGGSLCLTLGVVGIFVPVLPTTPFLLLAAACYARGSQRLHDWLLSRRILGAYIRNYREGRGMPLGLKLATLGLLWGTISYTALAVLRSLPLRVLLFAVAVGVTIHLLKLPTYRRGG